MICIKMAEKEPWKRKQSTFLYKKHTRKNASKHRQQIECAICFGWVDAVVKRIDEDTFLRRFVKRNKNSRWSNNTISYTKDLIK